MATYNGAQSFWVDPNLVQGASQIYVTALRLYFQTKPPAVVNRTGLTSPGVSIFVTECDANGVPKISPTFTYKLAYASHADISISSDASQYTEFRWDTPVPITTGKYWAFVMIFDQGAPFTLFRNKMGENLIGSTTQTPGASGTNSGQYFDYIGASSVPSANPSADWRAASDTDLKYKLFGARFYVGGTSVAEANTGLLVYTYTAAGNGVNYANGNYLIPPLEMECLTFDQSLSLKEAFIGPQMAYQNTFPWPGGRWGAGGQLTQNVVCIAGNSQVTANPTSVTGGSFKWSDVFNNYAGAKYLVIQSNDEVNIRKVEEVLSNTVLLLDEPVTFSNAQANFLLTPVGKCDQFNKASPFGLADSFLILSGSSANSTLRFVNNVIESISIIDGGTNYNNADKLFFTGYEDVAGKVTGGYKGVANLQTNSSGGIETIYLSNAGAGFINSSCVIFIVANSSSSCTAANTANGSGLDLDFTIGATVRLDQRPLNRFRDVKVVNIPISSMLPFFELDTQAGTNFVLKLDTRYEMVADNTVSSGFATYLNPTGDNGFFELTMFKNTLLSHSNLIPAFVSRSNEFNTLYINGAPNDKVNIGYSSQVQLYINSTSNNDFSHVFINTQPVILFSKYIINENYLGENTDQGNAYAKGITSVVSLANVAEDIVAYGTVYMPENTDIQVFARIHNSADPEAIDDKEWTRLQLTDGIGLLSSSVDTMNYIQLRWGFQPYPNVELTLAGTATATNGSAVLAGNGTTWDTNATANLNVGDMIRVYPTLFPNVSIVALVNAVTSDTSIELNNPIFGNTTFFQGNDFLGTPLSIDKIEYPHQAFNNYVNYNKVRYYNGSFQEFDGYDTLQMKVVLLSEMPNKIPRMDDLEVVASSP